MSAWPANMGVPLFGSPTMPVFKYTISRAAKGSQGPTSTVQPADANSRPATNHAGVGCSTGRADTCRDEGATLTADGCGASRGEYELFMKVCGMPRSDDTLRRMRALGQA